MTYALTVLAILAVVAGVAAYELAHTRRTKRLLAGGGTVPGPVTGNQHTDADATYDVISHQARSRRTSVGGMGSL